MLFDMSPAWGIVCPEMSKTNGKQNILAFFDVDWTLVDGNTGSFFVRNLFKEGLVPLSALGRVAVYSLLYHADLLPQKATYEWGARLLKDLPIGKAIALTDQAHERYWLNRYFAEGAKAIKHHKEQGHKTIIATSASDYISALVRDQLGADEGFGTSTLYDETGILTGKLAEVVTYGQGKLNVASEIAKKNNAKLETAYFYTDAASDLPLLEAVGHPIVVNPQPKLRKIAKKRNWPILNWKNHLSQLSPARPISVHGQDIAKWR